MGRPRIYDGPRVVTAVRLPAPLRDELQTVAGEREVSVNYLVIRAVEKYLRNLPSVDFDGVGQGHFVLRSPSGQSAL